MKKNSSQFVKLVHRSIAVAASSIVVVTALYFASVFDFLENKSFDHRTRATADFVKSSEDIILVAINQDCIDAALENYGWSWPWPRSAYGKMVEFISAGDVNSITFDMLFTEPSVYGPDDDEEFGRAISESGKVIQTLFVKSFATNEILYPVEPVKNGAAIIGNSTSVKDKDDVIRKARVYADIDGEQVPSMGIAPLLLQGEKLKKLPLQKDGSVILRFQRSIKKYTFRYATDILESYESWKNGEEGIYEPADFDDSHVFFALYGPGLFDICSTPVSQVYPGVGVHITQLDNYLNDCFVRKVPDLFVLLWFTLLGFWGAFTIVLSQRAKSQGKSVVIMLAGVFSGILISVGLSYLLFIWGIWLPLIAPVATLFTSFLISLLLVYIIEGKQKRFIKNAFSQCLAKEVVNQLIEHPETFKLGGDKFDMSAIFTDIEKFSSFSELLSAGQVVALLNYYLTRMSDLIMEEGGMIDKYEGDAIVALIGAPLKMTDHSERAVRAALNMKAFENKMNQEMITIASGEKPEEMSQELFEALQIMKQNNRKIFTRIGINSGEMLAGYMGSDNKKNYTMMGSNVNLASRLEGVNKQYSTAGILISENTRNSLNSDFIVRKLDRVKVVNVSVPIRLYEPLGIKEKTPSWEKISSYCLEWDNAMNLFEQEDYETALNRFKDLYEKSINALMEDKVALYYINLIEKYFIKGKYPQKQDDAGVAFDPQEKVFILLQK